MKAAIVSVASQHRTADTAARLVSALTKEFGDCAPVLWHVDDLDDTEYTAYPCRRVIRVATDTRKGYCAETTINILQSLYTSEQPELLLFPHDIAGSELAVRLAARFSAPCVTNVCSIRPGSSGVIISRMSYNGNLEATFESPLPIILTCPATEHKAAKSFPSSEIRMLRFASSTKAVWSTIISVRPMEASKELCVAERVVICGHGMGSRESVRAAYGLAEVWDALVAGTRPAAVDGWVPLERLVGISGTCISPEICIVLGSAGAHAFSAGIKKSGFLIGVNTDENALLFKYCDVGAVCDCVAFAQALTKKIQSGEE